MAWRPMVMTVSGGNWAGNALVFETKEEAEASAKELMMRWFAVTETRADETSEPVNYKFDFEANKNVPV